MKKLLLALLAVMSFSVFAIENGTYGLKDQRDGLVIIHGKYMMEIGTYQVGGPGGVSNAGLVPFPTVCTTKTTGQIILNEKNELSYEVFYIELVDSDENTKHCEEYVEKYRRILLHDWISFTVRANELVKL